MRTTALVLVVVSALALFAACASAPAPAPNAAPGAAVPADDAGPATRKAGASAG